MGRNVRVAVVGAVAALAVGACSVPVGHGGVLPQRPPTTSAPTAASGATAPVVTVVVTTVTTLTTAVPTPPPASTAGPGSAGISAPDGAVATGEAAQALAGLPVGPRESGGYDRDLFGQRWSDDVEVAGGHNGCDTRNDILRRDLDPITTKPGTRECVIATGTLLDPYTGETIAFVRGPDSDRVQIDHVVALSDAWAKGGRLLTPQQRVDFANDPLNLWAVGGEINQSKGNRDAAEWLPPVVDISCHYVARQIAVKSRYALWVTVDEKAAMSAVLQTCPDEPLPTG